MSEGSKCARCGSQCGYCGLRSTSDHPVMKTILLPRAELGSYVLRLRWTPGDEGRIIWVDFELIEVSAMSESADGKYDVPEYTVAGASANTDTTRDIEQAELAVAGFLKWDGCMQFHLAHVHVDYTESLEALLDAVRQTRTLAAEAMGDAYDQ